jgi:hypothetical protein
MSTYETIEEFSDENFWDIAPENAYHKSDCIAVLGRGDDAIRELSDWVEGLKGMGAEVRSYQTGATGMQAILSGVTNYTVWVPTETK